MTSNLTTRHRNVSTRDLAGLTGFINAGGRGTRLASVFESNERGVCKALLPLGRPSITFVEHQVNRLLRAGVKRIVVDVGDHNNAEEFIRSKFSDKPEVQAVCYDSSLESGGGLVRTVRSRPDLFDGPIFVCCVDTLLDIDERAFMDFHLRCGGALSVSLTTQLGVPNENAYCVDEEDRILSCAEISDENETTTPLYGNVAYSASCTGAVILESGYVRDVDWDVEDGPFSLYRSTRIIGCAIRDGSAFAYNNGARLFLDVGTPERWRYLESIEKDVSAFVCRTPYLER